MAYARKVPTKKMMLTTYKDYFKALWRTFSSLSKDCFRIDIVFDVYLRHNIKQGERNRRSKLDPIETNITAIKQQLTAEMDRFWSSSENKMKFQQSFIKWARYNYVSDVPIYLGGAECNSYDFGLNQSFRYASDLQFGMEKLQSYDSNNFAFIRFCHESYRSL